MTFDSKGKKLKVQEEAGCHYSHEETFEVCEFEVGSKPYHLGGDRFAVVKKYRGVTYVAIREYYKNKVNKDNRMLPGIRGINLTSEQWWKLTRNVMGISDTVRNKLKEDSDY